MSIIGIIFFSIGFVSIVGLSPLDSDNYTAADIENSEAALGLAMLLTIWGIAFSITSLVQSKKIKSD
tara:strand:+ start:225 stop:425 length:201 start_codon:yes stop_codon:yes gene_type:complete